AHDPRHLLSAFTEESMRKLRSAHVIALSAFGVALVASHCSMGSEAANSADERAGAGAPQDPGTPDPVDTPETDVLQEADTYRLSGNTLYILNRFKGLMVADLANLDGVSLSARLPIPGEPREMWVTGNTTLILTAQREQWGWGWGYGSSD